MRFAYLGLPMLAALPLVMSGGAFSQSHTMDQPRVGRLTSIGLLDEIRRNSGRTVVVNFWATWCKPCKEELPGLIKLRAELASNGLVLILVSADDSEVVDTDVRPLLKSLGVGFPSYIMNDVNVEKFIMTMKPDSNAAIALPTSFIFDRRAKLASTMVGGKTYGQFRKLIDHLLKE